MREGGRPSRLFRGSVALVRRCGSGRDVVVCRLENSFLGVFGFLSCLESRSLFAVHSSDEWHFFCFVFLDGMGFPNVCVNSRLFNFFAMGREERGVRVRRRCWQGSFARGSGILCLFFNLRCRAVLSSCQDSHGHPNFKSRMTSGCSDWTPSKRASLLGFFTWQHRSAGLNIKRLC